MISKVQNKPSSNIHFKILFDDYNIDWPAVYMLPHQAMYNTHMWPLKYKILNNVLFPNKNVNIFRMKPSWLCSFCTLCDETPFHIFYECECDCVKWLLSELVHYFQNSLILPT